MQTVECKLCCLIDVCSLGNWIHSVDRDHRSVLFFLQILYRLSESYVHHVAADKLVINLPIKPDNLSSEVALRRKLLAAIFGGKLFGGSVLSASAVRRPVTEEWTRTSRVLSNTNYVIMVHQTSRH